MNRPSLLRHLVDYVLPIEPTLAGLAEYPRDSDHPLFVVKKEHIIRILERFERGELSPDQITDWADLIECRDDLGYESDFYDVLKESIFELANPNLTHAVTPRSIALLKQKLKDCTWQDAASNP